MLVGNSEHNVMPWEIDLKKYLKEQVMNNGLSYVKVKK